MAFSFSKLFSKGAGQQAAPRAQTIGVDVGSAAIKVIEVADTEQALTLRTYGELQLGPYAEKPLGSSVELPQEQRIEAIIDVNREAGVAAEQGVLVIPLSVSFLTVVPIRAHNQQELESKINVEARKYIPMPLSEVALDWTQLAGFSAEEENGFTEVLMAAVEHATVDEYHDIINAIGLASAPSEIEAFSTLRALQRVDDTTLAILDFGARTAKLYIAREGVLERVHRIRGGGSEITKQIAEQLEIAFEEAENLKRNYTPDAPNADLIRRVTARVLERPLLEFGRIIGEYEAREGSEINRFVISGGVATFVETAAIVQEALGKEVALANPFAKVAYPAFMEDTLLKIGPLFSVSLGAALRPFQ